MGLLTIGAFARASRLSAKALRRYDDLGLLRPARVDPYTGYRYYEEVQLERARLVAWLRRIGMPLTRVRSVCDLYECDAGAAARDIRAYWAAVETETAARRELAAFLIDHVSPAAATTAPVARRDTTMTTTLGLRCAALSDRGLVREVNQDAVYAGDRLLAVADGYGAHGARAGAAAVEALKRIEAGPPSRAGDVLNALEDAVERANDALDGLDGSGTTLTALLWTGERMALVHLGDTRAYLLRDGEVHRLTRDHTVVQSMIDDGSLSPEEAAGHPRRPLLLKALDGDRTAVPRPDVRLQDVRAGDRYLLCTDGLSAVVPDAAVRRVAAGAAEAGEAVSALVGLVLGAGGPDNVGCVVADVVRG
ncbi:MerR family transcriptional regulator [Streptomyces lavendulocolor]|uniref:MerR family transcriptional regulator n=1 Tax=Streptomyces lavendulocolor TaxID=67316 RepID=UPI003C2D16CD